MTSLKSKVKKQFGKYSKVIIWGLRTSNHSHRYIHQHFYDTFQKLDIKVEWVDDLKANQQAVTKNSLLIGVNVAASHLPIKKGVYYALHNCHKEVTKQIPRSHLLAFQVYVSNADYDQSWNDVTLFNSKRKILYQPWATDLLPEEFENPIYSKFNPLVFWVGNIWDNQQHQGNKVMINQLKHALAKHRLLFVHIRGVPNPINRWLVRHSRIAPSFAGNWQVDHNYFPCRLWKNISYGQLGISNVPQFNQIFGEAWIKSASIDQIIDRSLSLDKKAFMDMTKQQQQIVARDHTYLNRLAMIHRALHET